MGAYNVKLTTPLTVRSWFSSTCKGKRPTIDRKIQSKNADHDVIKIDVKTMERRVSGQGEHIVRFGMYVQRHLERDRGGR